MAQPSNQPGFGAEKVSPAARIVQFGKYRVHKHLATGGMGTVYRAVDTESHLEVALKILMPELNSRPGPRNRFLQESRSAARLNHENIVSVFDSGEANGLPFIAMEFIQGTDLHEEVKKRGPLDLAEARLIILQAARALDHAHSFGIIHRDIKPANILLRRINSQPLVKLVDFGLARDLEGEDLQMTRPGTTVGTVDFMAPEQACDSRAADIRSDLYSLGGTWYYLLAGKAPFHDGSFGDRLTRLIHVSPPDLRLINPSVNDETWGLITRLLAKDPRDRFQSAGQLVAALEHRSIWELDFSLDDPINSSQPEREEEFPASDRWVKIADPFKTQSESEDEYPASNRWAELAEQFTSEYLLGGVAIFLISVFFFWVILTRVPPGPEREPRLFHHSSNSAIVRMDGPP